MKSALLGLEVGECLPHHSVMSFLEEPDLNIVFDDPIAQQDDVQTAGHRCRIVRQLGDGQFRHGLLVIDGIGHYWFQWHLELACTWSFEEDLEAEADDGQIDDLEGL